MQEHNRSTDVSYVADLATARRYDTNGWPEIKNNPLSKVGVFPYLGKQISPELDPEKIYQVYRPEEELSSVGFIESMKLIPWVNIHPDNLLGDERAGRVAPEQKGVHGVIGEDIYFDNGILYGNIKLFSASLQDLVDSGECKELSLGYGCRYEIKSGIWNGQRYDAIQRDMRANHVASVPQGRMGPDVAVLDRQSVFTIDAKDITMADEPKKDDSEKEVGVDEVMAALKKIGKDYAGVKGLIDKHFGEGGETGADADEEAAKKKADEEKAASDKAAADKAAKDAEEEEKKEKDKGMDATSVAKAISAATDAAVAPLKAELETLKSGGIKSLVGEIAQRDTLARKISDFTGTFDHADKTLAEVAQYGVEKLGIKCPKGSEQVALDAYMTNRTAPNQEIGFSLDSAGKASATGKTAISDYYTKAA